MLIVIVFRNLLAHAIGLLVLGSAITLAGAVFAPSLPGAIEIADTFDAVVATIVALTIARAILAYDPHLDIRSLRELRG
jgi:hydrogenase-4 membrane subunit HyfE